MSYAMGIDLGTSGVKVGIYSKTGEVIASCTEEYPMQQPQNGYAEQNPADWWNATIKAMNLSLEKSGINPADICGIGLSGQMHGLVLLDEQNEVIRPAMLWCDGRTGQERDELERLATKEKILEISANPAIASFTAAKILWVKKHEPENYEKARHILLPKDYIRFMLCGEYATDVSDASGTQLLDIKNRCWSDELLELFSIDKALLPRMYESADITGRVNKSGCTTTGVLEGTPIVGGGGDNACAAVGTGVVEDEKAFTTIGTSGVVFAHTSQMKLDPKGRVHTFCAAVKGEWHVMGVTQAAGLSLKWLRDTLCTEEKRIAEQKGVDSYAYLDTLAAGAPIGAGRLIYLPYLMGERTPHLDPNARGTLFGLSAMHEKKHIIRAVLEGISYSLKDCNTVFSQMGVTTTDMAVCGGGAKSPFLQQMLADVYSCKLKLLSTSEGACLGAAILAFCGAGEYSSVQEACRAIIKSKTEMIPNETATKEYEKYYGIYTGLYAGLKESYNTLANI